MGKHWQLAASLLLTAVVGTIFYRSVPDWAEAARAMLRANPLWLLLALGFIALHMVQRALRWGVLLEPTKAGISKRNLLSLTLVKYVVNLIPPRIGEVVGSVLLARKEGIPSASVIAASLFERILDTLAVIVLFGVYFFVFAPYHVPGTPRAQEIFRAARDYSIVVFSLIVLALGLLALLLRARRWQEWVPAPVRRLALSFVDGFRALHSAGRGARVVLLSLGIWLAICGQLYGCTRAYLNGFPASGALLIMALTVVGVAIPTPGGVGGFQFFMSLTLVQFFPQLLSPQDPDSHAAGISNGAYVVSMVPVILAGVVRLYREGLSLRGIARLSGRPDDAGGAGSGASAPPGRPPETRIKR